MISTLTEVGNNPNMANTFKISCMASTQAYRRLSQGRGSVNWGLWLRKARLDPMFSAQPAVIVQKAALANNFGSLANALASSAAFKAQLPLVEEHLDIYIIEI